MGSSTIRAALASPMRTRFKNGRERGDIVDTVRTADGVLPWTNKANICPTICPTICPRPYLSCLG